MNAPDLCPMLRLLLTERQAAAALGVSTDTLRREGKRRRVGYAMIAGRPRYTEQHLAAHIHAQEVKPCNESDNPTVPADRRLLAHPASKQPCVVPDVVRPQDSTNLPSITRRCRFCSRRDRARAVDHQQRRHIRHPPRMRSRRRKGSSGPILVLDP